MKYYPMVWLLWSNDSNSIMVKSDNKQGVHLEEVFAHKLDAESYLDTVRAYDHGIHYWIQEKGVFK